MQIADIFRMPLEPTKEAVFMEPVASVTSEEALKAVARLFRGEPLIAYAIPFSQPLFLPRRNVIIENLRSGS